MMNKTLVALMRVIVAASLLMMATAASKRAAAEMAKHVRTRLQFDAGAGDRAFDYPGKARRGEERPALAGATGAGLQ
jgi:hypothetical protein